MIGQIGVDTRIGNHVLDDPRSYNSDGSTFMVRRYSPDTWEQEVSDNGFARYGKLFFRDQTARDMDEWIGNDGSKGILSYLHEDERVGVKIPTAGRHDIAGAPIDGNKMAHAEVRVPLREIGKYLSKVHNLQDSYMGLFRSDLGVEFADDLGGNFAEKSGIDYLAVGEFPELLGSNYIFAISRNKDGEITLYAHPDAHKKMQQWAECEQDAIPGLTTEEKYLTGLMEEIRHYQRGVRGRRRGVIREERETKTDNYEFLDDLESGLSRGKDKDSVNRMKRTVYRDAATVNRYKKAGPAKSKGLADLIRSDISKLESILKSEAQEQGYNTANGMKEHVISRAQEIAEEAYSENVEYESREAESIDSIVERAGSDAEVVSADGPSGDGDGAGADGDGGESGGE